MKFMHFDDDQQDKRTNWYIAVRYLGKPLNLYLEF
jgi:hypothetical protein